VRCRTVGKNRIKLDIGLDYVYVRIKNTVLRVDNVVVSSVSVRNTLGSYDAKVLITACRIGEYPCNCAVRVGLACFCVEYCINARGEVEVGYTLCLLALMG
jgi:hypothetical protein